MLPGLTRPGPFFDLSWVVHYPIAAHLKPLIHLLPVFPRDAANARTCFLLLRRPRTPVLVQANRGCHFQFQMPWEQADMARMRHTKMFRIFLLSTDILTSESIDNSNKLKSNGGSTHGELQSISSTKPSAQQRIFNACIARRNSGAVGDTHNGI